MDQPATLAEFKSLATSYALIWDLIGWAIDLKAPWFDLGGVTGGQVGGDDPLGGISTFKRNFSRDLAEVSEEWTLVLRPARERIADALGRVARAASRRA